jgi:hypothetical protein
VIARREALKASERFLEAAREHGAGTTEEEARQIFRKVVGKPKPPKTASRA